MDWSIQQIAKLAGTTSRTLRHYDSIGLLPPSRLAGNGYRHYDEAALVRLQRILLLRELGLGLPQIADVLDRETSEVRALEGHLALLRQEQDRLRRQIQAVQTSLTAVRGETTEGEEELMAEKIFDGFDHTQYREEVEQRWGKNAYAASDAWWRGMSDDERSQWKQNLEDLTRAWTDAAERGIETDSDEAQELARRHVEWLQAVPGTPAAAPDGDLRGYVLGLAEMYVADERFAANYATSAGGTQGAEFVRDALENYVTMHMPE